MSSYLRIADHTPRGGLKDIGSYGQISPCATAPREGVPERLRKWRSLAMNAAKPICNRITTLNKRTL